MVNKYVKKPIPIEAVQWLGANRSEIANFCHSARFEYADEKLPVVDLYILTLEGKMHANVGDYIIKGVRGEFYPCEKNIFEETYERFTNG